MSTLTLITSAALALLTACGGGGSSEPAMPEAAATPIPAAAPLACVPQTVVLQFFGDSTANGLVNSGFLQTALNARYGATIVVQNRAVSGTDSAQLRAGTDGRNLPWPQSVDADIVIVEGGINEITPWAAPFPVAMFRSNFEAFATAPAKVIFMTPAALNAPWAQPAFPQTIRDVAAEHGIPVADADAYSRTLTNWQGLLVDGVHPGPDLQRLEVANVLMPTLTPLIDPMRCKA